MQYMYIHKNEWATIQLIFSSVVNQDPFRIRTICRIRIRPFVSTKIEVKKFTKTKQNFSITVKDCFLCEKLIVKISHGLN